MRSVRCSSSLIIILWDFSSYAAFLVLAFLPKTRDRLSWDALWKTLVSLTKEQENTFFLFTNRSQRKFSYLAKFWSCCDEDIIYTQQFFRVVGGSWASELFVYRLFLLRSNPLHCQSSVDSRVFWPDSWAVKTHHSCISVNTVLLASPS